MRAAADGKLAPTAAKLAGKSHPNNAVWESQLAQLAAYKAEHGNCNVPWGWAGDPRLSRWADTQRQGKQKLDRSEPSKGMTAERAARLTTLRYVWEPPRHGHPQEKKWAAQLAQLAAYKAAHGDCNVPARWADDPRLGTWVRDQRHRQRKRAHGEPGSGRTAERAARLAALGFVWDPPGKGSKPKNEAWETQFARLVAYNATHGECGVPRGWAEDPRLARWVDNQRMHKKKLDRGEPSDGMTAERAAKLTALGFAWNPRNAAAGAKPASMAAKRALAMRPPAGPGKRQRQVPGVAAPFMQLLY
jgi:hypothetical protein